MGKSYLSLSPVKEDEKSVATKNSAPYAGPFAGRLGEKQESKLRDKEIQRGARHKRKREVNDKKNGRSFRGTSFQRTPEKPSTTFSSKPSLQKGTAN